MGNFICQGILTLHHGITNCLRCSMFINTSPRSLVLWLIVLSSLKKRVLAQLANLCQQVQSFTGGAADHISAPSSSLTAGAASFKGEFNETTILDQVQSPGESSSEGESDSAPSPPKALMKGCKTVSMLALPASDQ